MSNKNKVPEGQVPAEQLLGEKPAEQPAAIQDKQPTDMPFLPPDSNDETVPKALVDQLMARMDSMEAHANDMEQENAVLKQALIEQTDYEKAITSDQRAERKELTLAEVKAPTWFMNPEGRKLKASPMLIKHQKKMNLVPCLPPLEA